MRILVKEAMEQGAYGGIYYTHIRNEDETLIEALKEAIEICEKTGDEWTWVLPGKIIKLKK